MNKTIFFWIAGFISLTIAGRFLQPKDDSLFEKGRDLPEILHLVDQAYVDEVKMSELIPGIYQGALQAVDENAAYIPPGDQGREYEKMLREKFGIFLVKRNGYAYAAGVVPGSAADRAGLRGDSYLRSIAGQSTRKLSLPEIKKLVTRSEEPEFLVFDPAGGEDVSVRITPGPTQSEAFSKGSYPGGVLYIDLNRFEGDWKDRLRQVLSEVPDEPETKVLLDLRDNAFGDLASAQALAALFLPSGKLVSKHYAKQEPVEIANTVDGPFGGLPLYVLINRGTSGGAEIFTAAANDMSRAVVMGEKSLGIPHDYERIALKNGGAVELSLSVLVLPSGKKFTGEGITPDHEIELEDAEAILDAAVEHAKSAKKAA